MSLAYAVIGSVNMCACLSLKSYLADSSDHPCLYFTVAAQSQGLLDLSKLELVSGSGAQSHQSRQPHLSLRIFF